MSEIMKQLSKGYELKEKYDFECAACGHSQYLKPAIAMKMGLNSGHGH